MLTLTSRSCMHSCQVANFFFIFLMATCARRAGRRLGRGHRRGQLAAVQPGELPSVMRAAPEQLTISPVCLFTALRTDP